jgi:hypothetical protein
MSPWKTSLAIAGLALAPLVVVGYIQLDAANNPDRRISEGERRDTVLAHLTKNYIALGEGVTAEMRAGTELAPVAYLNAELQRQGMIFRVIRVDGMIAETYDVS